MPTRSALTAAFTVSNHSSAELVEHLCPAVGHVVASTGVVVEHACQAESSGAVEKRLNGGADGGVVAVQVQ